MSWAIPCNPKYFDIVERFNQYDYVIWKRGNSSMKVNDEVYIYVGIPYKEIRYKCRITNADVNGEMLEANSYAKIGDYEHRNKYMQLELTHEFNPGIGLEKIKELGTYLIRKQGRVDAKLEDYLHSIESSR